MIGLGTLAKLAKGGFGPDEMGALCEAMGMEIELGEVPRASYRAAFGHAGTSLMRPGARMLSIRGKSKTGEMMEALIVMTPVPPQVPAAVIGDDQHTLALDSATAQL